MKRRARLVAKAAGYTLTLTLAVSATAFAAQPSPRIVGGSSVSIGDLPWQVSVVVNDSVPGLETANAFQRHFCGGTLVAPTIVITAAHCVYTFAADPQAECSGIGEGFLAPPSLFAVVAGRTVLSSAEGQEIDVAEYYYFEGDPLSPVLEDRTTDAETGDELFDCAALDWDVAILRLATPATAGAPIAIAGAGEEGLWTAGRPAMISGWGAVVEGAGVGSDVLRAASVSIVHPGACHAAYQASSAPVAINDRMLCAGVFPGGGVDACQGDSGGPLVAPAEIGRRIGVRLVGTTSFGSGCGQPDFPGVYARVAGPPIRGALGAAIRQISGANVIGTAARPVAPPTTRITRKPKRTTRTRKDRVRVRFRFAADEPAKFECKLDRGRFKRCPSSYRPRVGKGPHTLRVRAVDRVGRRDRTPARYRFRVKGGG